MTQSLGSLLSKLAVWAKFGQNLAQFGPFCKGRHYVSSALEVLMTLKNMLRLKI